MGSKIYAKIANHPFPNLVIFSYSHLAFLVIANLGSLLMISMPHGKGFSVKLV
jgi:hypothetical protein